ncbi:MAG: UDP-N-acetylglucosamine 1-carboxyvinyltransferase [Armatimonadota bacterium]|nr:UDP-N-acetylglucosamine 1-carboxyvinyltransferase [Armatimonadota bacterium]MDR7401370.1 UDP-N-acetylglucosamine 1-carboxyvinyltransferase [Armatimonadota bacterium]MDR7404733.1 UDP-N-acetylglucosamine 1-carboxyvinyltransferase [Armatimonadota bacterium]MDR7473364.1 UDP-N-acetylglucosamine 1-carboxyvinyltransferase [Armatimonadota bacterium]MDR7506108.1 UDP-N-acetylglucosamine 1-carboxyvinyltransferase [Armatimonadota bacterium]
MERLVVRGGRPLRGRVKISGGKNSSLAVITAACLAADVSVLENVPHCRDVQTLRAILEALGVRVELRGGRMTVDARRLDGHVAPYDLCRQMRASFYTAGLLLGRVGRAQVPLPGGCVIGSRPVDFHLRGFAALGATVDIEHGYMKASARRLAGTAFFVPRSSVGTTINLMLAACTAEGTTVLENAAREPEVVDTAVFLNLMGARIKGAGTHTITIEGVRALHGASYAVIPDRLEAGTYLLAAAATGGDVLVEHMIPEHISALLAKLEEAGAVVERGTDGVRVQAGPTHRGVQVDTAPYPGFATDLHPPFAALLTLAEGQSRIRETIFESRFGYVAELRRMGADIRVEGDTAVITGVPCLTGAPVEAADIRGGAAVIIAALAARGTTEISGVDNIDRGYELIEDKLAALGASVERIEVRGEPVAEPVA